MFNTLKNFHLTESYKNSFHVRNRHSNPYFIAREDLQLQHISLVGGMKDQ